jgi:hypothetical protein
MVKGGAKTQRFRMIGTHVPFRQFMRVFRNDKIATILFLALAILQQSCQTAPSRPPQIPAPIQEAPAPIQKVQPPPAQDDTTAVIPQVVPSEVLTPPAIQKDDLPESVLSTPETTYASAKTAYDTILLPRTFGRPDFSEWQYRQDQKGRIVGFQFSNRGGNKILPQRYDALKNLFFSRDFKFSFDGRARQDVHLMVADWAPSADRNFRLSELMNSVIHVFPRNYLPAIRRSGVRYVVTLPTGEEVEFDANSFEILGGVFTEAPVDLNPNKTVRKFPALDYVGKGVMVRANARGSDPRIGTTATITTGSPPPNCEKATGCNQCQVPSKELWHQTGAVRFKFPTDEEFDRYLLLRCGFGLPKVGAVFTIPSPVKVTLPSH